MVYTYSYGTKTARFLCDVTIADSAKRQGERGAQQLLDRRKERHPAPLPAPEGEDEQVQGRAGQALGGAHSGSSIRPLLRWLLAFSLSEVQLALLT